MEVCQAVVDISYLLEGVCTARETEEEGQQWAMEEGALVEGGLVQGEGWLEVVGWAEGEGLAEEAGWVE